MATQTKQRRAIKPSAKIGRISKKVAKKAVKKVLSRKSAPAASAPR